MFKYLGFFVIAFVAFVAIDFISDKEFNWGYNFFKTSVVIIVMAFFNWGLSPNKKK